MKKILFVLFALVPVLAFSQGELTSNTGLTRNLWVGDSPANDSVYTIGTIDMNGVDSIQIHVSTTDSARIQVQIQVLTTYKTTDTVTAFTHPNQALYMGQLTAAGVLTVPWFNIKAAIEPYDTGIRSLRIKGILYVVGTETRSSATADRMNWYVKTFKSR